MIKKSVLQIIIFVIIFWGITYYQERNMLTHHVPETAGQRGEKSIVSVPLANSSDTLFPTLKGEPIEVKAQGKQTIVYFFAPWCQICHLSIGNLQSIYENNPHIDIIAVGLDYDSVDEVREFTNQHQLTFPVVLGNSQLKKQFRISAYPSYYVLNKNNKIVSKSMGYSTELGLYLRTL